MGSDRRAAVVDPDLRAHALPNLWVASASVLPSSGSANPTLTLMLLARRLGDRLASLRR
jgi:choline dehydrogenase-like flavoprotein